MALKIEHADLAASRRGEPSLAVSFSTQHKMCRCLAGAPGKNFAASRRAQGLGCHFSPRTAHLVPLPRLQPPQQPVLEDALAEYSDCAQPAKWTRKPAVVFEVLEERVMLLGAELVLPVSPPHSTRNVPLPRWRGPQNKVRGSFFYSRKTPGPLDDVHNKARHPTFGLALRTRWTADQHRPGFRCGCEDAAKARGSGKGQHHRRRAICLPISPSSVSLIWARRRLIWIHRCR